MKKRIQLTLIFLMLVIFLVGCNDKSATIGGYHKLETEDFTGMHITPMENMSDTKQFSKSQTQDVYDYFLNIEPEESDVSNEKNTLESPIYALVFHFKESDYSVSMGDNYIMIALNGDYETIEEVEKNATLHLVSKELMNEFVEMIDKLMDEN